MLIPRAGSGLLEPFEPPGLALEDAIERRWRRRPPGRLLEPVPETFLPTYPLVWTPPPPVPPPGLGWLYEPPWGPIPRTPFARQ